ncbi:MAG: hypothetical protein AAEJ52_22365 [Myxococcota bacterium]
MRNRITWAVLGVLYLLFFSWYTSFGGPLSDEEVEHYFSIMTENNPEISPERRAMFRDFLESDTGDDFVMVNVIDLHDTPTLVDGVEPGETSTEVLGKYMEYMLPALLRRASHPVLYGTAAAPALEMFGIDGVRIWDQGAGMRYRSRRDMLEITVNPAFRGSHEFKVAAINKTFAFPIDPWFQLGDPRLVLALLFAAIGFAVSSIRPRG